MSNTIPVGKRLEAALEQYEKESEMSEKKRIYIAGPMTGLPNYNHAAFNSAAKRLRAEGWIVENPVDICAVFGTVKELESDPRLLKLAIDKELEIVETCDAIFLLHGWERSKGAKRELEVALKRGLEVIIEEEAE